jgi:AcrR family transcriptional regulator
MVRKPIAGRPLSRARKRDSERTKRTILASALKEFSQHGYSGARIERIAKTAKCNIRMLYHYFGNKEDIYVAVLERAYEDIRVRESELNLKSEEPLEGILKLMRFTFEYFANNPQFEGLLHNENMMRGRFVLRSKRVAQTAIPLRDGIADLLRRGQASGILRPDLDPVQIYVTIAALSRFHLANAYSLSALLKTNLTLAEWRTKRLSHACELLLAYLATPQNSMLGDLPRVAKPSDPRHPLSLVSRE